MPAVLKMHATGPFTGASSEESSRFDLVDVDQFFFTNQGGDAVVHGVDDVAEFEATKSAMAMLGITLSEQSNVLSSMAGERSNYEGDARGSWVTIGVRATLDAE